MKNGSLSDKVDGWTVEGGEGIFDNEVVVLLCCDKVNGPFQIPAFDAVAQSDSEARGSDTGARTGLPDGVGRDQQGRVGLLVGYVSPPAVVEDLARLQVKLGCNSTMSLKPETTSSSRWRGRRERVDEGCS